MIYQNCPEGWDKPVLGLGLAEDNPLGSSEASPRPWTGFFVQPKVVLLLSPLENILIQKIIRINLKFNNFNQSEGKKYVLL